MDVFTDGACSGNPGPGGWGWVTRDGRSAKGGEEHTTNQRMEVQAVLEALRAIEGDVVIHSDSTYVVNCFNDRWYEGWRKRGWKNSQKKPVANRDLWEPLIAAYEERADEVSFVWVKGHAGNEFNEIADQLAVAGADEQKALIAEATDSAPIPWDVDQAVWVVGATTLSPGLESELDATIAGLVGDVSLVVSGLRRGTELRAAEHARRSGVAVAVVLPFDDPAAKWPDAERARFDAIVEAAAFTVTLSGDPAKPGDAIAARNRWMAKAALAAIVVDDATLASALDDAAMSVVRLPAVPIDD